MMNGIEYLMLGFKLITKPGLKRYVLIPLIINISLLVSIFFIAMHVFQQFDQWLLTFLPTWLQWLDALLWIIFFISFFLVAIYVFVMLANIIAAPFNSFLAEKIEEYLTGTITPSQGIWAAFKDIPRVMRRQLAIIFYSLPRAVVFFILFFIPIVQFFAPIIWFFFCAWLMTLQYLDYPTDNHRISFSATRTFAFQHKQISFGFGAGALVCSMIPLINLFIMPAAVAGATALWIEKKN